MHIFVEFRIRSLSSSIKATPLGYPGVHLRLWISLIAPHGLLHKHHSSLHFSPVVAYCVDSSTPPFLLYHPFVKCEENLLPFTTNKESEALIAKSTLSLPSLFSAPPLFPCHFKCALCPQEERRVKNAFLNDTLASELLKTLLAIALLPEFEVFNFCLMLVAWNFAWVWTFSPPLFFGLIHWKNCFKHPKKSFGCLVW